jgi:imidazolonepropionase
MENIDLLIHSAGELCTIEDGDGPQRGQRLGELGIIEDGAVAVQEGRIVATGRSADLIIQYKGTTTINAGGHCVLPGFAAIWRLWPVEVESCPRFAKHEAHPSRIW